VQVQLIDARAPDSIASLAEHCGFGDTVALVGSSGVGKSTLVNTMTGSDRAATQAVSGSDGKGLHTTTVREMYRLGFGRAGGGWLVDTPGMRELQMSDVSFGVAEVFDDVIGIALQCRFTNCTHTDEPQCAIRAAAAEGTLDPARLTRWRKLMDEDVVNTGISARRRARSRKTDRRG
jgi:ribosome biogenesis GTPase